MLQNGGFNFHWEPDGSLNFECSYIPLFTHPITGKLCLGLSTFDCLATREWYRSIAQRYQLGKRLYYKWLPSKLYKILEQRRTVKVTVEDNSQQRSSRLNTGM